LVPEGRPPLCGQAVVKWIAVPRPEVSTPVIQTSSDRRPHTLLSEKVFCTGLRFIHCEPFQCVATPKLPLWPTTHTSLLPLPQIALNRTLSNKNVCGVDDGPPVKCNATPCEVSLLAPTAHTSLGPLPHTPWKLPFPVNTGLAENWLPSQCAMA